VLGDELQMLRLCAQHHIGPDALVKGDQSTLLPHGQRQQISVCDLAVPEQPLPIYQTPSVSRSASIWALLMTTPCDAKGWKPATPACAACDALVTLLRPVNASRNSSEICRLAVMRWRLAISFTAERMSSSITSASVVARQVSP